MYNTNKSMLKKQSQPKNKAHIKWDEQKIAQDELYHGTYDKINQPKTPYRQPLSDPEIEQIEMEVEQGPEETEIKELLQKADRNKKKNSSNKPDLNALNAALKKQIEENGWQQDYMQEEEDIQTQKKRQRFNQMRDKHYAHEFTKASPDNDD